MALNADSLKTLIQQKKQQRMDGINASDPANADQVRDANDLALAVAIVQHIQENLTVKLPSGEVVIAVVGQATGTMNSTPLDCSIE